jgi:RNA polymerase-binding protein DksA
VAKASTKKPSPAKSGGKKAAAAAAAATKPSHKSAASKPVVHKGTSKTAVIKSEKRNGKLVAGSSAIMTKPSVASASSVTKADKSMKKSKEANRSERPGRNADRNERKGVAVPAPVPTDAKPAKNQVGLKAAELEHFRDLLLAKRRELVGDMSSMEREALQRGGSSNLSNLPLHMADMGTDNYEQEFTLGLMEKDRNLLREINNALAKIQDGTYGICEGTGLPISKPRLEAQPWARFSIEHARKLEQRMGRM